MVYHNSLRKIRAEEHHAETCGTDKEMFYCKDCKGFFDVPKQVGSPHPWSVGGDLVIDTCCPKCDSLDYVVNSKRCKCNLEERILIKQEEWVNILIEKIRRA